MYTAQDMEHLIKLRGTHCYDTPVYEIAYHAYKLQGFSAYGADRQANYLIDGSGLRPYYMYTPHELQSIGINLISPLS